MTITNYNALRRRIFDAATQDPEIADAINVAGVAYVYELTQLPDRHAVVVLTAKTQLHDNLLREHGFEPDKATARLTLTLNRRTKCADI